MEYLHTPSKHWSIPYTEDEDCFTMYPTHGVHHAVHMDQATYWFHEQDHSKAVKVFWLDANPTTENDVTTEETEGAGQAELPVPGPPDEALPADDAGGVPLGVPPV